MRSSSKQIIETDLFFHNKMKYENLKNPANVYARTPVFKLCVCLCVCVILSPAPWLTSVSYLMDELWLHHLFCLQAGNGFDWPSRQHSGSMALSVCISSRKLSCWKRLIIGLKSGVMIVYWTHFPWGFLSVFLLFSLFHLIHFFSSLTSLSLSVGEWLNFNEIHLWP